MRCAILDDYQDVALKFAPWERLSHVTIERLFSSLEPRERHAALLADFEIIVAMRERTVFDAALLDALPKLKLLVTTGLRNASIDLAAAKARGITVCGTEGSPFAAAELAWALLLGFARQIPTEANNFRAGRWQTTLGTGLDGKTLGIVGYGKLGKRMAQYGKAFGMNVLAWSRSLTPEKAAADAVTATTLDRVMADSDVVSLHLTLNAETRGMIGARELGLMKSTALLVNTARGPLVNEAALVAALREGWIGGAALDVYDQEPLPAEHPLRQLDNVLGVSHLGYVTVETYRNFYPQALEDIEAWLAGTPIRVLN
jgi:phosphoglycerate dehydrogenase-like enzyme